jgi:hypothetical protein
MMRTIIMCAALALTITTAGAAEEDTNSANYIQPGCKKLPTASDSTRGGVYGTVEQVFEAGDCMGRVSAAVALRAVRDDQHGCTVIPRSATKSQAVRVVVRYIEARPQRMHEPFVGLVMEALHDAWPCKQ